MGLETEVGQTDPCASVLGAVILIVGVGVHPGIWICLLRNTLANPPRESDIPPAVLGKKNQLSVLLPGLPSSSSSAPYPSQALGSVNVSATDSLCPQLPMGKWEAEDLKSLLPPPPPIWVFFLPRERTASACTPEGIST